MAGHTDGKKDFFSPKFGISFRNSSHCAATSNTMHHGYTLDMVKYYGNNGDCVVKDNTGSKHPQNY